MLDALTGRLLACEPELLIAVGPLSLRLEASARTRAALPPPGAEVTLYAELVVREEKLELLGFARAEERSLYRLLTGVSGIGKRLALAILSALSPGQVAQAVAAGDEAPLVAVSGVGRKTASRLLLELKGRLDEFAPALAEPPPPAGEPRREEALRALLALGMSRPSALRALAEAGEAPQPVEDLIRRALAAASER
ncbi:Holliday junction branch migration protein RuvA [bacterium]|nr:Holliday junction branch migration protein RuvA [bacterium]